MADSITIMSPLYDGFKIHIECLSMIVNDCSYSIYYVTHIVAITKTMTNDEFTNDC